MTTRVWLIRHGQPAEESRGRCYGSLDIGLSEAGRAQMVRVAGTLEGERAAIIWASPRRRTAESARILGGLLKAPIEVEPDLREIDFGDFEGMTYDEIAVRYPEIYRHWMESPTTVQFPNGESEAEVCERAVRAFERICRERAGETVIIVSHGGIIRILLAWALRMPDECIFRLSQGYAAVNRLSLYDGFPCVELVNYCPA